MSGDQADRDPAHRGPLHVAVSAGGVAVSAGRLERLLAEGLERRGGEAPLDAVALSRGRIVEGCFVTFRDIAVTAPADLEIVGGPPDETHVGGLLLHAGLVTSMAEGAPHPEMDVFLDQALVDEVAAAVRFRPDRRRRPRSPLALAADLRRPYHHLHDRVAAVTHQAVATPGRIGERGKYERKRDEKASDGHPHPSLRCV